MRETLILPLLCMLFAYGVTSAENSFFKPGKEWTYTHVNVWEEPQSTVARFTVGEKTSIDGVECYTIHASSDAGRFTPYDMTFAEVDGLVSWYLGEDLGFKPLYDFSVATGDVVEIQDTEGYGDPSMEYVVDEIKEIMVNGIERKCIMLKDADINSPYSTYCWVEGIGAKNPSEYMTVFVVPTNGIYFGHMLECFEDGVSVFKYEDFAKATASVESVVSSEETDTPVYYDLTGREVRRPEAGGVYIRRTGTKAEKVAVRI